MTEFEGFNVPELTPEGLDRVRRAALKIGAREAARLEISRLSLLEVIHLGEDRWTQIVADAAVDYVLQQTGGTDD